MMLFGLTVWFLFTATLSESKTIIQSLTRYKRETHDIIKNSEHGLKNHETNRFLTHESGGVILKGGSDLPADFKGSGSADFAFTGESYRSKPFEVGQSHNEDSYWEKTDDFENLSSRSKENKNRQKHRSIDKERKDELQNNRDQNSHHNYEIWGVLFSKQSNDPEKPPQKLQNKNKNENDWTAIIFPSDLNSKDFVNLTNETEDLLTNHVIKNMVTTDTTSNTISTTTTSPKVANACQRRCHQTVTSEYNPMCGSDGVTYTNPGKLRCAVRCGKQITTRKYSTCGSLAPKI